MAKRKFVFDGKFDQYSSNCFEFDHISYIVEFYLGNSTIHAFDHTLIFREQFKKR